MRVSRLLGLSLLCLCLTRAALAVDAPTTRPTTTVPPAAATTATTSPDAATTRPTTTRTLASPPPAPTVVPGAAIDETTVRHVIHVAQRPLGAADTNVGSAGAPLRTLRAAFARAQKHLDAGRPTKIKIGPGVYRETLGHLVMKDKARRALLVIEGAGPDQTIWSGADVWPADKWQSLGDGLYAADWPHDWGNSAAAWEAPRVLGHRSEMVFVDGRLLRQHLLEEYDYAVTGTLIQHERRTQKWTYKGFRRPADALPPGSFGVAERDENGNKLYVRLPAGKSIGDVQIEVTTRRQAVRMDAGDRRNGKQNLVVRGITFQCYASRTRDGDSEGTFALGGGARNILIDQCRFVWNNGHGLNTGASHSTVRDSEFSFNGFSGLTGAMSHSVLEDNRTNFNNWRGTWGGQKGWWLAGVKMHRTVNQVVRNHAAIGNLTTGFWYDIQCEHVTVENLTTAANDADGLFVELSHGPFEIRRLLSAGNGGHAFASTIVGTFAVRDSILYGNRGGTMRVRNAPTPLPVAYLSWYHRTDDHANKYFGPERFRVENTVVLGGPEQRNFIVEQNGLPSEDPRRGTFRYDGAHNLFYSPAAAGAGFTFVDAARQPVQGDVAAWGRHATEAYPTLADPGFVAPEQGDFRLRPGSPLATRAAALPARAIDPALLELKKAYKAWAEAGLAPSNQ